MQRVPHALHPTGAHTPAAPLSPHLLSALSADALSVSGRPPHRVLPPLPSGHLCGARPGSARRALGRQQTLGPDSGGRGGGRESEARPTQEGRGVGRVSSSQTVPVARIFQNKTEVPSFFPTFQFNKAAPRADPPWQQRGDEILAQALHRGHFLKPFCNFFPGRYFLCFCVSLGTS